jgi:hypothetical protein
VALATVLQAGAEALVRELEVPAAPPSLPSVPASWRPVSVVRLRAGPEPRPAPESAAPGSPWMVDVVKATGERGRDLKCALGEGLRLGGECVLVWPEQSGDWVIGAPTLLRPIFTQRAELVVTLASPCSRPALGARPFAWLHSWSRNGSARLLAGPLAASRRALDLIPFEANADSPLFEYQLLAQAWHFGIEVATVAPPEELLAASGEQRAGPKVSVAAASWCWAEGALHRCGLIDSPRFHVPLHPALDRWASPEDGSP